MPASRWFLLWCAPLALLLSAAPASAQKFQLELRPRVGDTLRMRLDQTTEVSAARDKASPIRIVTALSMYSRGIVERGDAGGMIILAITDSIAITTSDAQARALAEQARAQIEGRRMRLRLLPDGTVALADEPRTVPREVNELVSVMPASFPRHPIAVGDTWVREMPVPSGARFGVPLGGIVRASFRLDSVSRSGTLAYVSMRGTFEPVVAAAAPRDSAASGSIVGALTVDRMRGWLSESRFLIQMRSTVRSTGAGAGAPMQFRMKITQHMRVLGERLP